MVNVGAGSGSYEPEDRFVVAVEPSVVMISQRPEDAAPVVQASARRLPLYDDSVDAAMAVSPSTTGTTIWMPVLQDSAAWLADPLSS